MQLTSGISCSTICFEKERMLKNFFISGGDVTATTAPKPTTYPTPPLPTTSQKGK
jgi:hypothetical protein